MKIRSITPPLMAASLLLALVACKGPEAEQARADAAQAADSTGEAARVAVDKAAASTREAADDAAAASERAAADVQPALDRAADASAAAAADAKVAARDAAAHASEATANAAEKVAGKAKEHLRIKAAAEATSSRGLPDWLEVDAKALKGTFKALPARADLSSTINESLIIELYSK